MCFADGKTNRSYSLHDTLQSNINKLLQFLQSNKTLAAHFGHETLSVYTSKSESDVQWTFAVWLMKLLDSLSSELSTSGASKTTPDGSSSTHMSSIELECCAPPLPADVLSVGHKKVVTAAFEFLVVFGICPFLLPGVGIQVKHRSELANLRKVESETTEMTRHMQDHCLMTCVTSMLNYLHQPEYHDIVLSRHISDILASLIQLAYGKLPKKMSHKSDGGQTDLKADVDCRQANIAPTLNECSKGHHYELKHTESVSCNTSGCCGEPLQNHLYTQKLEEFVGSIPSATLVRELLILQSGNPSMPQGVKVVCDVFTCLFYHWMISQWYFVRIKRLLSGFGEQAINF